MSEKKKILSRRELLKAVLPATAGALIAACTPRQSPPTETTSPAKSTEPPPKKEIESTITPFVVPSVRVQPSPSSTPQKENSPQIKIENKNITLSPELQQLAWDEFQKGYEPWMETYVTSSNITKPDQLRATWLDHPGSERAPFGTVSEAQSYAMVLAVVQGDSKRYQQLSNFYRDHLNEHGLMVWLLTPDGKPAYNQDIKRDDTGAASDADLTIAETEIIAEKKGFGNPENTRKHLDAIRQYDIEPGTNIIMPGDSWGGSHIVSTVYWSPMHAEIFSKYANDPDWHAVNTVHDRMIDNIHQNLGGNETGLVPNWSTPEGLSISSEWNDPTTDYYSWVASRYPWCQSKKVIYGQDALGMSQAIKKVTKLNSFFESVGPDNIRTAYKLDGTPVDEERDNNTFVSGAALLSVVSQNPEYQKAIIQKMISINRTDYFSQSLRMLSLAVLSGHYYS